MTLATKLSVFLLLSTSLWAVPRLRLTNTVVGPVTIVQGANAAAQDLEAYSVGEREATAETENLRLNYTSTAPWVSAAASTARTCQRRSGLCIPVKLSFSTQGLQPGLYSATVLVADPNALDAPQRILVSVSVGSTIPDRVNFFVAPNGSSDEISIATNSNIQSTVAPDGAWLSLTQSGAGTFDFVRPYKIAAKHTGQGEGTYNGTVQIRNSTLAADNKTVNVAMQVTSQPIATAGASALRVRLAQGAPKSLQRLPISNRGLGKLAVNAATATVQGGGTWLTAVKLAGYEIVDATFDAANVPPGVYKGSLAITHNGVNSPLNIPVEFEVVPAAAPAIRFQGVLENATFLEGDVLATGGIVAAFGEQFTLQEPASATALPLPQELNGVRVYVNDKPAPVYYASYGQVNFQIPYDVAVPGTGTVRIDRGSTRGNAVTATFVRALPKILHIGLRAAGINISEARDYFGIAVHQDGTLSLPREFGIPNTRPTKAGEVITLYGLGFGPTDPPVSAGVAAPSDPLARVASATQRVYFGALALNTGTPVDALYAGLTPGFVGLYQVNVVVPENSPKGDVAVRVQLDTVASEYALIAVE